MRSMFENSAEVAPDDLPQCLEMLLLCSSHHQQSADEHVFGGGEEGKFDRTGRMCLLGHPQPELSLSW